MTLSAIQTEIQELNIPKHVIDARAADNANFIPSPHSQGHSFSRPLLQAHLIRYKLPQLGI